MALLDFLKRKELVKIDDLTTTITELKETCKGLSKYEKVYDLEKVKLSYISDIESLSREFELKSKECQERIQILKTEIIDLEKEISERKSLIIELDEVILLQDFGMYSPIYEFANSELYKDNLKAVRDEQKQMILNRSAASCSTSWTVNGSHKQGQVMINQNIKQIIRCFNNECDVLIDKVKFNNVETYKSKIQKSFEALNKMNSKNDISLSFKYLDLKINELLLAYEFAVKKQEEKDEQKRIREQIREEAKLMKEIEEARKDIEKEQKHYSNALHKVNKQLDACDEIERIVLLEKRKDIEMHLKELELAINEIDYREANKRAGYVYIISNIGSFGDNVYKIGMTRRLEPMERVDELGDASVPFKFDVHAMIFSDDAPKLEAALHNAFEHKKVNMINGRREFFKVSIEEIEEVIKANYDKTVEFKKIPEAEQYRESLKIINLLSVN